MKAIVIILFLFCFINVANSQQTINTINEFKKKVKTVFSSEWQYLSTDLYLFNATKFDDLINEIYPSGKKLKKDGENLEYLLMTAAIKGLKVTGDLTYPIYNFQVKRTPDNKYTTQVTNNQEVIRILDNLPLASTNDYIDAEINVNAITNKNENKLFSIIASQLKNISNITNPSAALPGLVGEFGKLIDSKTMNKEYSFKSTIRIYEEQDFNKKLYSVQLYVFVPSPIEKAGIDVTTINELLDKEENPSLDRIKLGELINYKKYPFLAVINYKSKYIAEPVIGDEITFETIETRKQKIESAYKQNLINKDTYIQENKLLEFLEIFAQLKLEINNYQVNNKNKITEDFSKNFFTIMQNYRKLKNTFRNRQIGFVNSPAFKNEFNQKYINIILNAELYLENDHNLRNIKEMVNSVFDFENDSKLVLDSAKRDNYIRKLSAVQFPASEQNSIDAKSINQIIEQLENEQYQLVFKKYVDQLNLETVNDKSFLLSENLKGFLKTTNCKLCRTKVNEAISIFSSKYEIYKTNKALAEHDEVITKTKDKLFYVIKKENCIQKHLKEDYSGEMPAHIQLIAKDFESLIKQRNEPQKLLDTDIKKESLNKIQELSDFINSLITKISDGQAAICNKVKSLCDCND